MVEYFVKLKPKMLYVKEPLYDTPNQVGEKGHQGNLIEEEGLVSRTDTSDEEDSSFDLIN